MPEPVVTKHGALKCTKYSIKENDEHVYALALSPDGKYLAATYGNGALRVLNAETLEPLARGRLGEGFDLPVTGVKFRPPHEAMEAGVYEIALASSGGAVFLFNFDVSDENAVYLDRLGKQVEGGNETAAVDYSPESDVFVTAGSDRVLRLYSAERPYKLLEVMDKGHDDSGHSRPAHTNRIFSTRFASKRIICSGGWEAPVQMWDMATKKSEGQIVGPQVSADTIEPIEDTQDIIVASKRDTKQLQVFDYLTRRELTPKSDMLNKNLPGRAIGCVRASPQANIVWAVTAKPDTLLCISYENGEIKSQIENLGAVLCMERSRHNPKRVYVGGRNEALMVVELEA